MRLCGRRFCALAYTSASSISPSSQPSGLAARRQLQVGDVGKMGDCPAVHAQHMLAEGAYVVGIVGDDDHRYRQPALQRIEFDAHARAQAGVERGERLVQQQGLRMGDQRARQRHALTLAARQLVRHLQGHRVEFKRLQPVADLCMIEGTRRIEPAAPQAEADVLPHIQMREQRVVLEQIGDAAPLRRDVDAPRAVEQRPAGQHDAAAVRRRQAGDGLQQLALAGAGRAVDDDALAVRGEPGAQLEAARAGAQRLVEVHFDQHGHGCWWRLGVSLLATISTVTQVTEVISTSRLALSSWPACTASYTAIDSVCVLPGMLPATISVAPNSPIARANASSAPASTPRQASGSVTRRNTPNGAIPSTRAACSNCRSTVSNAERADFKISGSDTTAAAITAACHVKIRLMPNARCSHAPSQPLRPNTTSR